MEEQSKRSFSVSCLFPETGEFKTVNVAANDIPDAKQVAIEELDSEESPVVIDSVIFSY